jgi:hypothetical protein
MQGNDAVVGDVKQGLRSFVEATASLYGDLIVPAGHLRKSLMGPACLTLPNHD